MTQVRFHGYVAVQRRGLVAIPPELRKRHHLDEPGAQVEITERADGVLELRPTIALPAAQAWFWTPQWQEAEAEADADLAAARTERFDGGEDFMTALSADMESEDMESEDTRSEDTRSEDTRSVDTRSVDTPE